MPKQNRKVEFWWASIHGADPEPVEKTVTDDGRACVYTLGCADPFYLDESPCPVLFIEDEAMLRPKHPDKEAADLAAMAVAANKGRRTYVSSSGKREPVLGWSRGHGWRGPR
jgi:hypothetical protein